MLVTQVVLSVLVLSEALEVKRNYLEGESNSFVFPWLYFLDCFHDQKIALTQMQVVKVPQNDDSILGKKA